MKGCGVELEDEVVPAQRNWWAECDRGVGRFTWPYGVDGSQSDDLIKSNLWGGAATQFTNLTYLSGVDETSDKWYCWIRICYGMNSVHLLLSKRGLQGVFVYYSVIVAAQVVSRVSWESFTIQSCDWPWWGGPQSWIEAGLWSQRQSHLFSF